MLKVNKGAKISSDIQNSYVEEKLVPSWEKPQNDEKESLQKSTNKLKNNQHTKRDEFNFSSNTNYKKNIRIEYMSSG